MKRSISTLGFSLLSIIVFASSCIAQGNAPLIVSVTREQAFPLSSDSVVIRIVINSGDDPVSAAGVTLCYSVDNSTPSCISATAISDTSYTATIPAQGPESIVTYWATVEDVTGRRSINPADTSRYKHFYLMMGNRIGIHDVQTTPNRDGRSGVVGFQMSLTGIVVADTSNIPGGGDNIGPLIVIQDSRAAWSGISIPAIDTAGRLIPSLVALRRGDATTVTGIVRERDGLTILENAEAVPAIGDLEINGAILSTGDIGRKSDGESQDAEKWESMVVRYEDVVVVDSAAEGSESGEFLVADILYAGEPERYARIETDESNAGYTTDAPQMNELRVRTGWTFQYIRGILIQSGKGYKLIPRSQNDYSVLGSGVKWGPYGTGKSIVVRPNPASDATTIDLAFDKVAVASIDLLDATGQLVAHLLENRSVETGIIQIDTRSLSAGAYFIRIVTSHGATLTSMTVIH